MLSLITLSVDKVALEKSMLLTPLPWEILSFMIDWSTLTAQKKNKKRPN